MRSNRKEMIGKVVSAKMQKTIVVLVEQTYTHPLYKKTVTRRKKYKAHDEHQEAREGDIVLIRETRPLSKEKRWRLVRIIKRGEIAPTISEEENLENNETTVGVGDINDNASN
ncbi:MULTISPECIES: 30S ribosomal protein S17 [Dictyoglomus]|uniref:Small ribosomal subunit protein uS17 n=1 Tax=Dictyoglomus turgidum (strain DSM 6724 / Z-1310) TaxID=515635 RepID=B8E1E2_DICTD|nr:ribosomal protein S17 [Dictyoglomus turgidum DSM 6724]PNV80585.1 MAG: 30S ribosomal protein S17 [Dictyoglomus turgidum]HBU31949.1 30S ribosomal protein S17 [Dictyoglomus sp.]